MAATLPSPSGRGTIFDGARGEGTLGTAYTRNRQRKVYPRNVALASGPAAQETRRPASSQGKGRAVVILASALQQRVNSPRRASRCRPAPCRGGPARPSAARRSTGSSWPDTPAGPWCGRPPAAREGPVRRRWRAPKARATAARNSPCRTSPVGQASRGPAHVRGLARIRFLRCRRPPGAQPAHAAPARACSGAAGRRRRGGAGSSAGTGFRVAGRSSRRRRDNRPHVPHAHPPHELQPHPHRTSRTRSHIRTRTARNSPRRGRDSSTPRGTSCTAPGKADSSRPSSDSSWCSSRCTDCTR